MKKGFFFSKELFTVYEEIFPNIKGKYVHLIFDE